MDGKERWKAWHRANKDPKKNLRQALQKRGVKLKGKKGLEVPDLLKAVELDDYLSMQAQIMLAELLKTERLPDLQNKREARRFWKAIGNHQKPR